MLYEVITALARRDALHRSQRKRPDDGRAARAEADRLQRAVRLADDAHGLTHARTEPREQLGEVRFV